MEKGFRTSYSSDRSLLGNDCLWADHWSVQIIYGSSCFEAGGLWCRWLREPGYWTFGMYCGERFSNPLWYYHASRINMRGIGKLDASYVSRLRGVEEP